MDRKKIIINEIKYWKQSRLLPDHYCDFLLTLYSEGEQHFENKNSTSTMTNQLTIMVCTTIVLAVFGLTFLVIYFTDFSLLLQIASIMVFSGVVLLIAMFIKKYDNRFVHLFNLIAAVMIFLGTIQLADAFYPGNSIAIAVATMFNCGAWLFIGRKYKLRYFIVSSIVGVFLVVLFIFL